MVSILIPTYEMAGRSVEMLHDLLTSLDKQTYKDYEVIISDDSSNEDVSDYIKGVNNVKYFRNDTTKGAAFNLNHALTHAKGNIIKPIA